MESKGLWLSVLGTVLMAGLGFGFAHLAESDAIFLDGVFSLVSFIMSLLMVYVSRLLQRNADHRFQLGYASFEPAFNVLQSLVILGVLTMALASALAALSGDGRLLQPGVATVYAVLATVGCLAVYLRLRTIARETGSELVRVDAFVWLMDCILSLVVLVTFLAVWLLGEHLGDWLPYVDSLMVIVMVLIMLPAAWLLLTRVIFPLATTAGAGARRFSPSHGGTPGDALVPADEQDRAHAVSAGQGSVGRGRATQRCLTSRPLASPLAGRSGAPIPRS